MTVTKIHQGHQHLKQREARTPALISG